MDNFSKKDKQGQVKVVNQLDKLFSGHTHTFSLHYIDKARIDIEMDLTASTTNNIYHYNIECKDREYNHQAFDKWMIEEHKINELINKKGYYANTYTDDWLMVWDISKLDISTLPSEIKELNKTTVVNTGKNKRKVYYLPTELAVYSSKFV